MIVRKKKKILMTEFKPMTSKTVGRCSSYQLSYEEIHDEQSPCIVTTRLMCNVSCILPHCFDSLSLSVYTVIITLKVTTLCWCIFSAMVFNTFFKKTVNSVLCQFFFLIWQGFITESLDKLKEIKQQILHKEWSIICDYYTLYSLSSFSLAKS